MRISVLLFSFTNLISTSFAAPAAYPTVLPRALAARDVIVNVGAVSPVVVTETRVIKKTATATITVEGRPTLSPVVEEVTETKVVTSTATAISTEVEVLTVVQGVTVPVTLTTTGFEVDIQTAIVTIQQTSTFYTQQVQVVTVQGEPSTSTTSFLTVAVPEKTKPPQPDAQPQPSPETGTPAQATETKPSKVKTVQATVTAVATSTDAAGSSVLVTHTTVQPTVINVSAGAGAGSNSTADVDSSNTNDNENTNNVTLNWVEDGNNKTYVIIGACALGLLLLGGIGAIIACSCGGGKSSRDGPVIVSGAGPGAVVAKNLANKPKRSARRTYQQVGRADESDSGMSSGIEQEEEGMQRAMAHAKQPLRSSNSMASLSHGRRASSRASSRAESVKRSSSRNSRRSMSERE